MDSLTQIVLGAACGEVVLGKKVGNRAMLWGAIGGTIPDLDIILGPFISEVDALAIHRGFSHSIVFSILLGITVTFLFYRKSFFSKNGIILIFFYLFYKFIFFFYLTLNIFYFSINLI